MVDHDISPFFRSPFSDITGSLLSYQLLGGCKDLELSAYECIEAYGMDRGYKKCSHLLEDFYECHSRRKQFRRFQLMRNERERQIKSGKLCGKHRYEPIRADSF